MRGHTVIDPGHGGASDAGRSTAFGVRGPRGLLEKDVTLAIAARAAAHLGAGASLTRTGDVNLSLAARAETARRLGARAFLSVHANAGGGRQRGAEVWIHSRASAPSAALAEELVREVARFGAPGGARVLRGDLAVLEPSVHLPDAAACLVEVDFLDHPEAERRFGDPRTVDQLGQALARGLARFLDRPAAAFGRAGPAAPASWPARALAADLTGFDAGQFSVIADNAADRVPNNVTRGELATLQAAWGRMNAGVGLSLQGSAADKISFRAVLLDCMATSAVLRAAFLAATADDGSTVTLDLGRSQPHLLMDAFEHRASSGASGRGLHTLDLDDLDRIPRVATVQHGNLSTKTHYLIHALTEAATGVRSAIADPVLRYLASHFRAIDGENRYRAEQGMQGVKGYDQPAAVAGGFAFHFRAAGSDVAVETWHVANAAITAIDYVP